MSTKPIDYDALAQQHGGQADSATSFSAGVSSKPDTEIDYDSLASAHGGKAEAVKPSSKKVTGPSNAGPWEAVKRFGSNLAAVPGQVYDAVTKPPQTPEENAIATASGAAGPTADLVSHAVIGAKRMVVDPMQAEAEKSRRISKIATEQGNPDAQHLANMHAIASGVPVLGPIAAPITERYLLGDKSGAITELGANIATPEIVKKGTQALKAGVGAATGAVLDRYRPTTAKIANVDVPVLVGEAHPLSGPGENQTSLKAQHIGSSKFNEFARNQQAAVKTVIRNVARSTSDMTGPLPEAPGAAMSDAAGAVFAKARPMYQALDDSMTSIPDTLQNVSAVVDQAINKAKKYGVEIKRDEVGVEGGNPSSADIYKKYKTSLENTTNPRARTRIQAAIDKLGPEATSSGSTPLTSYLKVKSALLKMQRASSDPAVRFEIGNEVGRMDTQIETTLKGTPLWDNYQAANRLWSKGHALSDIADVLTDKLQGTPESSQAPGLSVNPTQLKGGSLVSKLNDLDQAGVLNRGLSGEEVKSLRQAADILDRSTGEVAPEDLVIHGYSTHSTLFHAIKAIGMRPFVKVMTTPAGVAALQSLEAASDAGQASAAIARITTLAQQPKAPKNRKELKQSLEQVQ